MILLTAVQDYRTYNRLSSGEEQNRKKEKIVTYAPGGNILKKNV
jgi:hypothetical protein